MVHGTKSRRMKSTSDFSNPIISFNWGGLDFDLASYEFMIGLLAVAFPPKGQRDWLHYFHTPPTPEELREVFQPYAAAFSFDGEGPRFLQDFSPLKSKLWPIGRLFMGAPGENTEKKNTDLFIKSGHIRVLSRASAAIALYTLQQFASGGGSGFRTSLRGGGPLTTLVVPGNSTLWQKLWLHVPTGRPLDQARMKLAFPWLTSTTIEVKVSEADADPLQAFFGMPRRIQLIFESNEARRACDLMGEVDDIVVTGFSQQNRGVDYAVWRHPLTPYYKKKGETDRLPVLAPDERVGYKHWLGLVYASPDESQSPASAVVEAQRRLCDLDTSYVHNARLMAGGYKMNNAKAITFAETEMPLHAVADPDLANRLRILADHLVKAASTAVSALGIAVKSALLDADAKFDLTLLDAPRERLWTDTEREFHDVITEAVAQFERNERDVEIALAERWRRTLEQRALRIFDETAPLDDFDAIDPRRVVEARRFLVLAFKGFGKIGRGLFNDLGLPPTEPKGGRSNEARSKRERGCAGMTKGQVKTSGGIAHRWWTSLQPARERGYKGDAGALARLRRGSLIDAMTEPETVRLHRELGLARQTFSRAALVACVLSHVREDQPGLKVARAAGPQSSGEAGVLSALRFRRLLNIRGEEDCSVAFRRLVALLGEKVNIADLAESLLDWNDEEKGDRCCTRWAFDYYDAGVAAPDREPEATKNSKIETAA